MLFRRAILLAAGALLLLSWALVPRSAAQSQDLDREFQAAVAQYDSGHYADAAEKLEKIVRQAPESFEVHELLGLVYAAQSQNDKADEHLMKAVRLNPKSVPARTNLAANLAREGKLDLAGEQFKKAVELEPTSYDTNHNLGEAYAGSGKVAEAISYLEKAQKLAPGSYDNGYDLSLAYEKTGRFPEARQLIHELLKAKNTPELHNLLGLVEEKDSQFVAAENEYEIAAHMEPSESNLFDWGGELLIHRTLAPAVEVFQQATQRYPSSQRLAVGLGMAYYARGNYDDAVKSLLRAADLNPREPSCYYFLSKAYDSSPSQAADVIQRFRRFAELQPQNARAQYYFAMSLWKGKRAQDPDLDLHQIQMLLDKALMLDPKMAEAHLQLGNLYSDQAKYTEAIPEYARALQLDSDLADAHYRLAQALVRTGGKDRAQDEFQAYQKIKEQQMADLDRQRAAIRQFVYAAKDAPASRQ